MQTAQSSPGGHALDDSEDEALGSGELGVFPPIQPERFARRTVSPEKACVMKRVPSLRCSGAD